MIRNATIVVAFFLLASLWAPAAAQENDVAPWPVPENIRTGTLKVSDIHTLYYEVGGNPEGIPLFMLHGGPGGFSNRGYFTLADPEEYYIVVFDQRGSGKSTPFASVEDNTTAHLVEDINALREHLNIEKPAVLWGVSWGATLALAYAQEYPQLTAGLVLISTFTGRKWEIDHIYHGGAGINYPEIYEWVLELVDDSSDNLPAQYFSMITGADEDLAQEAALRITAYELNMLNVEMTRDRAVELAATPQLYAFAKISSYYMMNYCFLVEGQLLRGADAIADMPIYCISGRVDPVTPPKATYDLMQRLNNAVWYVSPGDSHNDAGVFNYARRAINELTEKLKGPGQ